MRPFSLVWGYPHARGARVANTFTREIREPPSLLGLAFLKMNGFVIDIRDTELLSVVDRAGVSAAL